jgi:hypothetical protein
LLFPVIDARTAEFCLNTVQYRERVEEGTEGGRERDSS